MSMDVVSTFFWQLMHVLLRAHCFSADFLSDGSACMFENLNLILGTGMRAVFGLGQLFFAP